MAAMPRPEVWIGLVEVVPLPDSPILETASGAFAYVLTTAIDRVTFRKRAEELMFTLRVQIMGLSEIEPVREKRMRNGLSEELREIAEDVELNPTFIRYSTFYTWNNLPT
jgi:hypothetical protein